MAEWKKESTLIHSAPGERHAGNKGDCTMEGKIINTSTGAGMRTMSHCPWANAPSSRTTLFKVLLLLLSGLNFLHMLSRHRIRCGRVCIVQRRGNL